MSAIRRFKLNKPNGERMGSSNVKHLGDERPGRYWCCDAVGVMALIGIKESLVTGPRNALPP